MRKGRTDATAATVLAPPEPDAQGQVVELVRRLAGQARHGQGSPLDNGSRQPDRVILDIEVDCFRCVLIQRPPRSLLMPPPVALSPREQEIARMVAKGYPNKTIAAVLDISAWTVSSHLRRIFAKYGVASRAAMVARLLEESDLAR
jgi:DNA-binding CsgD family transcriptional regulator